MQGFDHAAPVILTPRLRMRGWAAGDGLVMRRINTDAAVTRYLNRPVDPRSVDGFLDAAVRHWATHGFGIFAVESREPGREGRLLGFAASPIPPFSRRSPSVPSSAGGSPAALGGAGWQPRRPPRRATTRSRDWSWPS